MNYTTDDNGISDDILRKAQNDIRKLLEDVSISQTDRVQLEIQSYFLMFMVSDHKKINQMYPFYLAQKKTQEVQKEWFNRLQWVIIPLVVGGIFTFIYQAAVFFFQVIPLLEQLKK